MRPRLFVLLPLLLLPLMAVSSCQRKDPEVQQQRQATPAPETAETRGQSEDNQRRFGEMQARLARTEAELEEANRRLVRAKVENAKLRQEINARRKQGEYQGPSTK